MSPTLSEPIADEDLTKAPRGAVRMKELEEMSGPHLVHGREQKISFPRYVGVLVCRRPIRVGRSDIVSRRQIPFIRAGNLDVREVLALVWRCFLNPRFLRAGNRDDIVIHDILPKLLELIAGAFYGTPFWLVCLFLCNTSSDIGIR